MADDAEQSERTERASARRLRTARENGDIAVSRDWASWRPWAVVAGCWSPWPPAYAMHWS